MITAKNEKKLSTTYSVSAHNINPDGVTVITGALQKLIDECSSNGGGEIVFPAGRYLFGSI